MCMKRIGRSVESGSNMAASTTAIRDRGITKKTWKQHKKSYSGQKVQLTSEGRIFGSNSISSCVTNPLQKFPRADYQFLGYGMELSI